MELRVRPWTQDDIPEIVQYWTTIRNVDADRMGCDLSRFPAPEQYKRILEEQLDAPHETASAFYSMWVVNGDTIGFASLKNIRFGIRGEMHLHIWNAKERGKGIGGRLFCLSAIDFFERVITGFWPLTVESSIAAWSNTFGLACASRPTPMFKTTFSSLGTAMVFL